MVKRTYAYRRYYRRNFYNRTRTMRNYFKAKLDTVQKIQWTGDGANFTTGTTGTTRTIADLVALCVDWQYWRQLFHTFLLTGIAVEICPNFPTFTNGTQFTGTASMGLLTTRESVSYNNVVESNFSFMLGPSQVQRKYKRLNGGLSAWHGTDELNELDGKFSVETDGNPTNGATTYSVKFTFYITFKNPN